MRLGNIYQRIVKKKDIKAKQKCSCVFLCVIFTIFSIVFARTGLLKYRDTYLDVKRSFDTLTFDQIDIHNDSLADFSATAGRVVYFTAGSDALHPTRRTKDNSFGLEIPQLTFALVRESEYCQWREHVHEANICLSSDDDSDCTVLRTYTYTKGWERRLIPSFLFNQAAAHHNPQRNPFPSGIVDASDVDISSPLSGCSKKFTLPAKLASGAVGAKRSTVHFDHESLSGFLNSPAAAEPHKFFYTNKDGWFYSKYAPKMAKKLLSAFLQYAEGTLFDFQIGDLFETCEAGDVRVRFQVLTHHEGISVVAKQVTPEGRLSTFSSFGGKDIAFVQAGIMSPEALFAKILADALADALLSWLWSGLAAILALICGLRWPRIRREPPVPENTTEKEK